MRYIFEWDTQKAKENLQKHGISFDRAASVFLDPNAISIFDADHSHDEDRWATLGLDRNGVLLVIIHTFTPMNNLVYQIRMISARKATKQETRQYQQENL